MPSKTRPIELEDFLKRYNGLGRRRNKAEQENNRKITLRIRTRHTARRTPQAVIKLASKLKNIANIRRAIEYIEQDRKSELIDQRGNALDAKLDSAEIAKRWIEEEQGSESRRARRKDAVAAVHLILSSPKHTTARQNLSAARALCNTAFDGHEFIIAQHNDTANLHTHVIVKNYDDAGKPLNWRKASLNQLRESWAGAQAAQGVNVTYSPRNERGEFYKGLSMAEHRLKKKNKRIHKENKKSETPPGETPEWLKLQLQQARYAFNRHARLQRELQASKDKKDKELAEKNRQFMINLIEKTRAHVHAVAPNAMPQWLLPTQQESAQENTGNIDTDQER